MSEEQALEEERHHLMLEALADVDVGRVVAHEEVEAWANGLGRNRPRRSIREDR